MRKLILIGASTGGPGHIGKIVKALDEKTEASFIIVQHMEASVLESFASQLATESNLPVSLAEDSTVINSSSVYLCKENLEIIDTDNLIFQKYEKECTYSPSIEALFLSALELLPKYGITAIILTGIGDDGSIALSKLYDRGALCIAESKESAKVYGMPKAAYEQNNNIEVMDIDTIVKYLKNV